MRAAVRQITSSRRPSTFGGSLVRFAVTVGRPVSTPTDTPGAGTAPPWRLRGPRTPDSFVPVSGVPSCAWAAEGKTHSSAAKKTQAALATREGRSEVMSSRIGAPPRTRESLPAMPQMLAHHHVLPVRLKPDTTYYFTGQMPPKQRYFISRNSSMPYFDPSRPSPDSLTPPNGATSVEIRPVLMPTIPDSSASATRHTRPISRP